MTVREHWANRWGHRDATLVAFRHGCGRPSLCAKSFTTPPARTEGQERRPEYPSHPWRQDAGPAQVAAGAGSQVAPRGTLRSPCTHGTCWRQGGYLGHRKIQAHGGIHRAVAATVQGLLDVTIRVRFPAPVGAGSRVRRGRKSREQYSTSTELIPKVKARVGRIGIDKWLRHSLAALDPLIQVPLSARDRRRHEVTPKHRAASWPLANPASPGPQ